MKKALYIVLVISLASLAFAESGKVLRFTDSDLEHYKPSGAQQIELEQDPGEVNVDEEKPVEVDKPTSGNGDSADSVQKEGDAPELKRYEVPYKPKEGDAPRIIIQVKLNGRTSAPMLLDTGSPDMVISFELADRLKLFESRDANLITTAAGIGGTVPAILTIVDNVEIGEVQDEFVPTTITDLPSDEFEGLIGMDFMANYSLNIDTKKHILVFQSRPITPDMPAGHGEEWWRVNFKHFAAMRTGWRQYHKYFEENARLLDLPDGLIEFTARQSRAADSLFSKLNGYAVDHYVPMEWRKY